jgi:hypothetical protein
MFRENKDSKIFIILIASLVLFTLIPYLVHASVNEMDEYPEATTSAHPAVYLTHGSGKPVPPPPPPPPPALPSAGPAPLPPPRSPFYAAESGTPLNVVSGTIIYINSTPPTNFLQVNNTLGVTVHLWINGSLPGNLVIYVNNITYTLGSEINLTKNSSPAANIGFAVNSPASSNSYILYFNYRLAYGIDLIYVYPIYVNK